MGHAPLKGNAHAYPFILRRKPLCQSMAHKKHLFCNFLTGSNYHAAYAQQHTTILPHKEDPP